MDGGLADDGDRVRVKRRKLEKWMDVWFAERGESTRLKRHPTNILVGSVSNFRAKWPPKKHPKNRPKRIFVRDFRNMQAKWPEKIPTPYRIYWLVP